MGLVAGTAQAVTITENINFSLSGFVDITGSTPPPITLITGAITVTYDPDVDLRQRRNRYCRAPRLLASRSTLRWASPTRVDSWSLVALPMTPTLSSRTPTT